MTLHNPLFYQIVSKSVHPRLNSPKLIYYQHNYSKAHSTTAAWSSQHDQRRPSLRPQTSPTRVTEKITRINTQHNTAITDLHIPLSFPPTPSHPGLHQI